MYRKYLSDSESVTLLSDEAFIKHFLIFESTLARIQSDLDIIPANAFKEIHEVLSAIKISPSDITDSFLANGIPTIVLLNRCKEHLTLETQRYLHYGITSQDAIDTSHILMYRNALDIIQDRQIRLIQSAAQLSEQTRNTYTVARTRSQQAGPISYGVRIALWMNPIVELRDQLKSIRKSCLKIQLAGAFGTNVILGENGEKVATALAKTLDLFYSGNWQNNRLNIKMLSDWLCSLTGSLGKIAKDILFLSSTEVGEIRENRHGGGKSSSMPHKSNPILSEAILALAAENGIEAFKINQAQMHGAERDASAWILEWKAMKTLLINTATCLNHMITIFENLELVGENTSRNLELTRGLIYTAMAKSKLMNYLPDTDPEQIISQAIKLVNSENISLAKALNKIAQIEEDWADVLIPSNYQGNSDEIINTFLANAKRRD